MVQITSPSGRTWILPSRKAKMAPLRTVAAKLPLTDAVYLRAYAHKNNVPIQAVLIALVAEWVKLNQELNHSNTVTGYSAASPVPLSAVPIPATAAPRRDTGKSLPAAELQEIDVERREAAADPRGFKD